MKKKNKKRVNKDRNTFNKRKNNNNRQKKHALDSLATPNLNLSKKDDAEEKNTLMMTGSNDFNARLHAAHAGSIYSICVVPLSI